MNDSYLIYLMFLSQEITAFSLGVLAINMYLRTIGYLFDRLEEKYIKKEINKTYKLKLYSLVIIEIIGVLILIFILGILMHTIIVIYSSL